MMLGEYVQSGSQAVRSGPSDSERFVRFQAPRAVHCVMRLCAEVPRALPAPGATCGTCSSKGMPLQRDERVLWGALQGPLVTSV